MRDVTIDLVWNKAQIFITTLGGFLGWYLGGNDGLLVTLVVFACIDYVTGVMCAVSDRTLSSAIGSRGIFRKMTIFALVGIGHIVDSQVIGTGSALRSAVICFYLSNEGVSIIENAAHLGLPIPNKLKAALEQLHNRDGQNTGDE